MKINNRHALHQKLFFIFAPMTKCIIAAIADNGAIGAGGALPWHISEDLKYFKRTTMSCPVIMGRKTFESLGRPLPGRTNIVLSRKAVELPEGVLLARDLQQAYSLAEQVLSDKRQEARCFVIGGAEIYRQALADADELYITRVHLSVPEADAFFPEIDCRMWQTTATPTRMTDEKTGVILDFEHYSRRKP